MKRLTNRLLTVDYDAIREAFDRQYKETRDRIENGETHLDNLAEGFTEADRVLRGMPSVVRCGECRHWKRCDYPGRSDGCCLCLAKYHDAERPMTEETHFCAYGEGRADND